MCVIFVADKVRPSADMIERGYETNPSGAGIAWREKGLVRWEKGLDLPDVQALAAKVPFPFVVHFRIPTCGGDRPSLCHPFPVDVNSSLALEGSTKGFVLFHNGHWNKWRESMLETLMRKGTKMPAGKWSDSRAMAWTAAHYDINVLELIEEKCVVLSPDAIEIFGNGWTQANDLWVSNTHWQYRSRNVTHVGTLCREKTCAKTRYMNTDFCFEHQPPKVEPKVEPVIVKPGVSEVTHSAKELTFRDGVKAEGVGSVVQQEVQTGAAALRGGGEAGEEEEEVIEGILVHGHPALTGTLSDQWHWARRLNKPDPQPPTMTLAERRELRAKGIEVLGPM